MRGHIWTSSAIFAALLAPSLALAGSLSIKVEGLRSAAGSVLVAVCTAESFQGDRCREEASVKAAELSGPVRFTAIAPGAYAVKIFHDENANGTLDTDWLGIPVEGYGLSNNPPKDRRPTFQSSSFSVGPDPVAISISLFYR